MYIPAQWSQTFSGAPIERPAIGESGAEISRIRCINGENLFVKSEPVGANSELPEEIERLRWMSRLDLPGPTVLDVTIENNRHWLLMSAVPGQDLASANDLSPPQVISILAVALRTLHQVPIETCPFDHPLDQRIAARSRVSAGLVDETDFDDERLERTAEDVLAEMLSTLPKTFDLAVTQGDACLPNFMVEGSRLTGYIDCCGRLGISDIYQNLALAARSIARNFGPAWVAPFFCAYGVESDQQRLAFCCLLDEFY